MDFCFVFVFCYPEALSAIQEYEHRFGHKALQRRIDARGIILTEMLTSSQMGDLEIEQYYGSKKPIAFAGLPLHF